MSGTKLWTSGAHVATTLIVLARTDDVSGGRPGRRVCRSSSSTCQIPPSTSRPVITIDGSHHFNEVFFDDALVPQKRSSVNAATGGVR